MAPVIAAALILALAAATAAPAAENASAHGEILKAASLYRHGDSREPLIALEALVRETSGDEEARRRLAAGLAAIASNTDATRAGRSFACRQISIVGTDAEVPILARLLLDEEMTDIARYALERISSPAADAALRSALSGAHGSVLAGLASSLGARRDPAAVPLLGGVLAGTDEIPAAAAAGALGLIATPEAAAVLMPFLDSATPAVRPAVVSALLACAAAGASAPEIIERLSSPEEPPHVRASALGGRVALRGAAALPEVLAALEGDEPALNNAALRALREMPLPADGPDFVEILSRLPETRRPRLLAALAGRRDAAGRRSVRRVAMWAVAEPRAGMPAAEGPTVPVRIAGARALESVGDASAIPPLAAMAGSDDEEEAKAARRAIARLRGTEIDPALIAWGDRAEDAGRLEIIRALGERKAPAALPFLRRLAETSTPLVAEAAIAGIGDLGGDADLSFLLDRLLVSGPAGVRDKAAAAVRDICRRSNDRAQCEKAVCGAFSRAESAAREELLGILPLVAGTLALQAALGSLDDGEARVRKAAIRALGKWPDPSPARRLLDISRGDDDLGVRGLAYHGYIRLIVNGMDSSRPPAERIEAYRTAIAAAPRVEDLKPVLSELSKLHAPEALDLIAPYLDRAETRAEAADASVGVAEGIRWSHADLALAAAARAARMVPEGKTGERARKVVESIRERAGYVTAWSIAGPYAAPGLDQAGMLDAPFPPDDPSAKEVAWRPRSGGGDSPWRADLVAELDAADMIDPGSASAAREGSESLENCVAYLRAHIKSPRDRRLRMEIGSDDGVKAWLNGEEVHANPAVRGLTDGEDRVKVRLRKGWNVLLLKVAQGKGDWGASVRFRKSFGRKVKDLVVRTYRPEE